MQNNKQKLLLADDDAHIRTLMKTVMQSLGFEVIVEAENGQEAVERFQYESPDVTLLDINMPVKTGIEALAEIKKINPGAFVIMLTSLTDINSIEQCLELGASSYIRKDNPVVEIKSLVQEAWQDFENAGR
ncbi:MAG: response regulator [Nitrospinaceae bacterium]|nr:MAG: response regulator [Nitrospinaceae bacterium]